RHTSAAHHKGWQNEVPFIESRLVPSRKPRHDAREDTCFSIYKASEIPLKTCRVIAVGPASEWLMVHCRHDRDAVSQRADWLQLGGGFPDVASRLKQLGDT